MIKFIAGFCTIIAAAGAAEGSAGLGTAILLATVGTIILLWSISSMIENGDIV